MNLRSFKSAVTGNLKLDCWYNLVFENLKNDSIITTFQFCLSQSVRRNSKLNLLNIFALQLGRLLVYMLNPCQDIRLACFALHLANHPRASDILNNVLTVSSAGTKVGNQPLFRFMVVIFFLAFLHLPIIFPRGRVGGFAARGENLATF